MTALHLSARLADALAAAAAAAYPEEFCALLIGRDGPEGPRVTRVVPAPNRHPHPRRGFELDPAVLIGTLRALRDGGSGERLVGHAHSHPDGAAVPSATDRSMAWEAGLVWMVIAVVAGRARAVGAWRAVSDEQGEPDLVEMPIAIAADGVRGAGRADPESA